MHYDIQPVEMSAQMRMAESRRRAEQRRLVNVATGRGHRYPRHMRLSLRETAQEIRHALRHLRHTRRPAQQTAR